MTDFYCTTLF